MNNESQKANLDSLNQQEKPLVNLQVYQNGSINLNAPIPPKEVVKLLQNICTELVFGAFQPKEDSGIVVPQILPGRASNESH
ncbi:MAG: hypothetical protein ACPGTP_03680 [Bacteroidia bacterium]